MSLYRKPETAEALGFLFICFFYIAYFLTKWATFNLYDHSFRKDILLKKGCIGPLIASWSTPFLRQTSIKTHEVARRYMNFMEPKNSVFMRICGILRRFVEIWNQTHIYRSLISFILISFEKIRCDECYYSKRKRFSQYRKPSNHQFLAGERFKRPPFDQFLLLTSSTKGQLGARSKLFILLIPMLLYSSVSIIVSVSFCEMGTFSSSI